MRGAVAPRQESSLTCLYPTGYLLIPMNHERLHLEKTVGDSKARLKESPVRRLSVIVDQLIRQVFFEGGETSSLLGNRVNDEIETLVFRRLLR